MIKPNSVEDHLKTLSPQVRGAVEKLRRQLLGLLPDAVETISYGLPTLKVGGRSIIHFAGFKNHCSLFPGGGVVHLYADELKGFKTSKGTIQFTPDHPLPESLVEKMVRDRLEAERPKMKQ